MKAQRVGRRKFLGMAGSAAVMSAVPRTSSRSTRAQKSAPKIKVGVIGINHSHIYGQVEAVQRGGGELVSFYAKEADLAAAFAKRFPQAARVGAREGDPRESRHPAGPELRDSGRAGAARHPGDAARQGLHVRQAGHHDAEAARRGAPRAGRDPPDLLDHVQRAAGKPGDGQSRRAGQGRRHRPGRADDRPRAASHEPEDARRRGSSTGRGSAASCATSVRTRRISSCTSPARPVPTSWPRRSATSTTRSTPRSRTSAT